MKFGTQASLAILALHLTPLAMAAESGSISGKVQANGTGISATVFIENAPGSAVEGNPAAAPLQKMSQRNSAFAPGVLVVRVGEVVDFPNEDKIYHNVFSLTPGNDFDLGLYRGGVSKSTKFEQTGEVDVYCNIHPDMKAKVLVLAHGWNATARADGSYELKNVPPGTYTLVAWTPNHEPVKREVVVKAGAATRTEFIMNPRKGSKNHLNKFGEQYGRYK